MGLLETVSLVSDLKSLLPDGDSAQAQESRQLRLLLGRQLDVSPEKTAEVFDKIRAADSAEQLADVLAQALRADKATTLTIASAFANLLASQEHKEALSRLTARASTLRDSTSRPEVGDQLTAIATAQRNTSDYRHCLDVVPIYELYVPQRFRDMRTGSAYRTPKEAGAQR